MYPITSSCYIPISADVRHYQKKMLGSPTAAFTSRPDTSIADTNCCCLLGVTSGPTWCDQCSFLNWSWVITIINILFSQITETWRQRLNNLPNVRKFWGAGWRPWPFTIIAPGLTQCLVLRRAFLQVFNQPNPISFKYFTCCLHLSFFGCSLFFKTGFMEPNLSWNFQSSYLSLPQG